ncbi:hypothetical protein ACWEVY_28580 [Streptomyces longwoodensis]
MTVELGVHDSGVIAEATVRGAMPHVRDKEDVPHEHAIPDFYGLPRGFTLSEFNAVMEGERRLRAGLLDLIDQCTEMQCAEDDETFGLLIIHTKAYSKRRPRTAVEYVDMIISDRTDEEGHARVRGLVSELTQALMVEVERVSINRPHPQLDGSTSFKIVRYAKAVLA